MTVSKLNSQVMASKSTYLHISNIMRTQLENVIVFRYALQLPLCILLHPGVKSKMKMYLEQRRQAMLRLHLSDQ